MKNIEYYENKRKEINEIINKNFNAFFITSDIDYKYERMFFKIEFLFYTIKLFIKFSDIEKNKNQKELENYILTKIQNL